MKHACVGLGCLIPAMACSSADDDPVGVGPSAPVHVCVSQSEAVCREQVATGQVPQDQLSDCVQQEQRRFCTDHYLRGYPAADWPSCIPGAPIVPIPGSVDIAILAGTGVSSAEVLAESKGLQRYFEPHDLWFFTAAPAQNMSMSYLLVGSPGQLQQALTAAGIPTTGDLTPAQEAEAERVVGDIVFGPLRDFLAEHAQPPTPRINVTVLINIAQPELQTLLGDLGLIAGLSLSPVLLDRLDAADPELEMYSTIGIPKDFTPSLFVGHRVIATHSKYPDNVIAHETGHALGLVHTTRTGNLMVQEAPLNCRLVLDASQVSNIAFPGSIASVQDHGLAYLAEVPRRLVYRMRGDTDAP